MIIIRPAIFLCLTIMKPFPDIITNCTMYIMIYHFTNIFYSTMLQIDTLPNYSIEQQFDKIKYCHQLKINHTQETITEL